MAMLIVLHKGRLSPDVRNHQPIRADQVLRNHRHRAQWLVYNLFMRKAENIDSIAPPTAQPDFAPMPPILPVKSEWRAAVLGAER
jgi:hypothetical protein